MKKYYEIFNDNSIVTLLCKMRVKEAKRRSKKQIIHTLSLDPKYNFHKKQQKDKNILQLSKILPSRRKWKKIGQKQRYTNGLLLNSVDRNLQSLIKTVKYYKDKQPEEDFYVRLLKFIKDLKGNCKKAKYKFHKPQVYPKPKSSSKEKVTTCRPIAIYPLMDKIIICLANKYFTHLFDDYLDDCAFAFRAAKIVDGKVSVLTHHDAFQKIIDYRKKYSNQILYVAECDMMKFYDTVNHTVIKKHFRYLINRIKRNNLDYYNENAVKLFYKFLDSYNFNKQVLPLNNSKKNFTDYGIPNGKYGWVEKDLIKEGYYKSIKNAKIGVPQGGALSGLVANVVLNYVDRKLRKYKKQDLLYIRFCDDMIIMHPDKKICNEAFITYQNALRKLKLLPHKAKKGLQYNSRFWGEKSKLPYAWGPVEKGFIPWIGFVGYEINYKGDIRARKTSYKNEMRKQYELLKDMYNALSCKKNRASLGTIEESAINRLIGMSVGRVNLWNYLTIKNEMCWLNGFKKLTNNKYSRIQLKRLDRSRNHQINKFIKNLNESGVNDSTSKAERRNYQRIYYGKPFSYYYQMIEKK